MNTILPALPEEGKARLKTLIAVLNELDPDKFFFAETVKEHDGQCGTVCCAIGWTPALFPDLAQWGGCTQGCYVGDEAYNTLAARLFGMSSNIARGIFVPEGQQEVHDDLELLYDDSTPKEVAAMLTHYIELTETPA